MCAASYGCAELRGPWCMDFWGLGFEAVGELFDNGVGEDFAGDALDFGVGGGFFLACFEGEEEVFALADVVDAAVFHAAESVGYGLALGVEHSALESDIDMGLHRDRL